MDLKIFRNCIALVLLLLILTPGVFAQTFTVSVPDTMKSDTLNSEIIFDVVITNVSSAPVSVYMVRKTNILPTNWQSSLCFDYCFAPFLDSIATTSAFFSSPLAVGEKRTMSIHFFPAVNYGTGYCKLEVGNLNIPSEHKTFNFTANASLTAVNDIAAPGGFYLAQNYPNPFNPSTVINYRIAHAGLVTITLHNIIGEQIASLVNEYKEPGQYQFNLDARVLSAGVYIYKLQSGNFRAVKKMMLLK
jgi:hypothetical protein